MTRVVSTEKMLDRANLQIADSRKFGRVTCARETGHVCRCYKSAKILKGIGVSKIRVQMSRGRGRVGRVQKKFAAISSRGLSVTSHYGASGSRGLKLNWGGEQGNGKTAPSALDEKDSFIF